LLELAARVVAALAAPLLNNKIGSAEGRKYMLFRQILNRSAENAGHKLSIVTSILCSVCRVRPEVAPFPYRASQLQGHAAQELPVQRKPLHLRRNPHDHVTSDLVHKE
jgi:hypothetical protein